MNRLKKRSSKRAPAPTAPSSSAALAATSAFVKSANSNASLSSAAAATALRSHTPPPTNPADITTKRMVRRGSTSSHGSAPGSRSQSPARPGLQRSNSNGSMSERSFRSSSPHRVGNGNNGKPAARDAPPVPALPPAVTTQYGQHKRASSVEPEYQRVRSPPPRNGGRGMSVDTANRSLPPIDTKQANSPTTAKRNSVNFSRPMSPPLSPTEDSSPVARQGRSGWHTAPVVSNAEPRQTAHEKFRAPVGPAAVNAYSVQQNIADVANAPVKTKKKQGLAAAPAFKPTMVFDPNTRTMKPASEMQAPLPHRNDPDPAPEPLAITTNLASRAQQGFSPTIERQQPHHQRATSGLSKQPSIVRERRDEEEEAEATSPKYTRVTSPTPGQARPQSAYVPSAPAYQHTRTASLQREAIAKARETSLSPGRQARFSAAPIILGDDIRHDPPPRSLSPAKPALKQSPASSVRTASPVANFTQSPTPRVPPIPPSDASVSGSEDGRPVNRKKSVRVSFGDEPPQIIPEAVSPPPMAPARPVYDDETFEMAPRPVLPSFGSIRSRERQSAQIIPEQAVKVTETVPSTSTSAHGSADSATAAGLESSSDLALGGILTEDLLAREAFLSGEPAEYDASSQGNLKAPLPPQVTSVEGSGYVSEPSDIDEDDAAATAAAVKAPPVPAAPTVIAHPTKDEEQSLAMSGATLVPDEADKKLATEQPGPIAATVKSPAEVPSIAAVPELEVQPPTPAAEANEADGFKLNMPGGSADLWDDDAPATTAAPASGNPTSAKAAAVPASAAQPAAAQQPVTQAPVVAPVPASRHVEDESETESVYSDAEEDLSEPEGFASLNAIVESPIVSPPDSPTATRGGIGSSPLAGGVVAEPPAADWAESKAYWSQLSEQRKQELERQARPDAYVEEPTPTPAPRPAKPQSNRQQTAAARTKNTTAAGFAASMAAPILAAEASAPRQPKQQKPLRSSMRQSQPQPVSQPQASQPQREEVRMRRSMRGSAGQESNESEVHHFRQSMRAGPGAGGAVSHARQSSNSGSGLQQSRYASPQASEPRAALQNRTKSPSAPAQRPQHSRTASGSRLSGAVPANTAYATPSLARRGSDGSDSSFKRSRSRPGGSVMSDGGFSMRRSMRGSAEPTRAPAPTPTPAPARAPERTAMARTMRPQSPGRPATSSGLSPEKARRFSIRSLSPSGSLLGGRKKQRASMDAQVTPAQSRHSRVQSADMRYAPPPPSQARQSAAIPAPTMRARDTSAPTSRFKSRYADDSDEEDSPVFSKPFRSRFLDSDDEDEPQTLRPVRGIPRKPGAEDGDSTDLEEESEVGELPSRKEKDGPAAQGSALASGSMRNKNNSGASGGLADSKHAPSTPSGLDIDSPVTTPRKEKRSFFSIRRPKRASSVPPRATPPIDYTQPLPTTNNVQTSPTSRPGSRPQSPKLQRRRTPQSMTRMGSDSWPLTPTADTANAPDPLASPAPASVLRPDVGKRRSTIDGSGPSTNGPGLRFDEANVESTGGGEPKSGAYSSKTGKKKKFPMLRKAFGLHD